MKIMVDGIDGKKYPLWLYLENDIYDSENIVLMSTRFKGDRRRESHNTRVEALITFEGVRVVSYGFLGESGKSVHLGDSP